MPYNDLNMRNYWRIVKKRKAIIILTTLLVGLMSFSLLQIYAPKPIYKATSKVKYEQSAMTVGFFTERAYQLPWDTVNTQAIVIKSFPVMVGAAKELGLIGRNATPDQVVKSKVLLDKINSVQKSVSTEKIDKTNIIAITGISHDPRMAQKIANAAAQVYRENNIAEVSRRTLESAKFIEEQIKVIGTKLMAAEEQVKNFKKSNNLVSLDFKIKAYLSQQEKVELQYDNVKNELKETEIQLNLVKHDKALPSTLAPMPEPVVSVKPLTSCPSRLDSQLPT